MIIKKYGLILTRLNENHLEEVRTWRNSREVSDFMVYKKYITSKQQLNWFSKINNDNNYYFIINHKSLGNIGLVNIKDIDNNRQGECGIFMANPSKISPYPIKALFILFDYAFNELNLLKIKNKILQNNTKSVKISKALGFAMKLKGDIFYGILLNSSFEKAKKKYIRFLK